MEKGTSYKVTIGILVFILFLLNFQLHDSRKENAVLQDQLDEYQSALSEANDNIDSANSMIEEAQDYAWSSYEDMGYALDNLSTVDTVSEPY